MNVNHTDARSGERGATAILVAASLLVLMGFAALAIDSGVLFSDRRQQQSAADVGALAAVQFADTTSATALCSALSGPARAACRGAEEAIDVVEGTLPGRYTLADWSACTDPGSYAQVSSLSPCISYTTNFQTARVVLPGTAVDTSFARVIGFNSANVGAFAEANLDLNQSGQVLPFAVGPSGAGASQACFFAQSTSNLDIDPCLSSTQGNFGKLSLFLYGNSTYGTPQICSGGNAQRFATNVVLGADHPLEPAVASPGNVNDDLNCPIITNSVDQVETWTGNAAGALYDGLYNEISTPNIEGRLRCKGSLSTETALEDPASNFESAACVGINSNHPETIDDTPLWTYITGGAAAESAGFCTPAITTRPQMQACLVAWNAFGSHTVALFSDDLLRSPRFGAVPILDGDPGGGFGTYLITDFRPIYIETLYLKCNANSCDVAHSPGQTSIGPCPNPINPAVDSCGFPSTGNKSIEAVTSFILRNSMLPESIRDTFPYTVGTIIYNLSK